MEVKPKNKIAIIPARGGSSRIKHKNIVDFGGKPLIAHTILAALHAHIFDQVIVSTDDESIAEVSKEYGATVPFLRDKYADAHSPASLATLHTLKQLGLTEDMSALTVVQLLPSCPLRDANDILASCDYFDQNAHFFQISAFDYGWMNPWWAHTMDENQQAQSIFPPEQAQRRSQDLPQLYCPTGAIWIARADKLIECSTYYGEQYRFFPISWQHALDIDNMEDLEMGRLLLP